MPHEKVFDSKAKSEVQNFNTPDKHAYENCTTSERKVVNVSTFENDIASEVEPKTAVVPRISSNLSSMRDNRSDTKLLVELQGRSQQQQHWSAQHRPKLAGKKRVSSICVILCWNV